MECNILYEHYALSICNWTWLSNAAFLSLFLLVFLSFLANATYYRKSIGLIESTWISIPDGTGTGCLDRIIVFCHLGRAPTFTPSTKKKPNRPRHRRQQRTDEIPTCYFRHMHRDECYSRILSFIWCFTLVCFVFFYHLLCTFNCYYPNSR